MLKNCVTSSKLENGVFQFYVNNKMVYKHRDVNCHVYDIQYTDGILKFKGGSCYLFALQLLNRNYKFVVKVLKLILM